MKVHESVDIAAAPELVWRFIVDPQRMADWHVKLEEVRRDGTGPVYVGERFGATYCMSKNEQKRGDSETEVVRCDPWSAIVLRHRLPEHGAEKYVEETFQLSPRTGGAETHVEHSVNFGQAGIPWWARALMWFITCFGEAQGEGVLDPLKRACEAGQTPATS
jgi:uncharacterized protein YndB with AHSA1/START domain